MFNGTISPLDNNNEFSNDDDDAELSPTKIRQMNQQKSQNDALLHNYICTPSPANNSTLPDLAIWKRQTTSSGSRAIDFDAMSDEGEEIGMLGGEGEQRQKGGGGEEGGLAGGDILGGKQTGREGKSI